MRNLFVRPLRRLAGLLALPALALAAGCDDNPTEPGQNVQGVLTVVLNSTDNSLTVVPTDGPGTQSLTVDLGPSGTPVGFAVRGQLAVVPLGIYPFAAVVAVPNAQVVSYLQLPTGSGATGVAFVNDNVVLIGNPDRNTVIPVDVRSGATGPEIATGVYPHRVYEHEGRVFVVNANLVNFTPAGPGSVTVLGSNLSHIGTVQLSGINPGASVFLSGKMYVLNSGNFDQANGSLSVVDIATLREERLVTGFGAFPGSLAVGPDGNLYVGVYGTGVLVWNPSTRAFVRGLDNPIVPGGSPPVSAVAFDRAGRMHTTNPRDCQTEPGSAYRFSLTGTLERTVTTGLCPFFIGFADAFLAD